MKAPLARVWMAKNQTPKQIHLKRWLLLGRRWGVPCVRRVPRRVHGGRRRQDFVLDHGSGAEQRLSGRCGLACRVHAWDEDGLWDRRWREGTWYRYGWWRGATMHRAQTTLDRHTSTSWLGTRFLFTPTMFRTVSPLLDQRGATSLCARFVLPASVLGTQPPLLRGCFAPFYVARLLLAAAVPGASASVLCSGVAPCERARDRCRREAGQRANGHGLWGRMRKDEAR